MLSNQICEALIALQQLIEDDIDIRCVVITGEDEAFCAGADLKERKELDEDARWKYVKLVDQALLDIEKIPVPVIAAINGQALGGGTELTLVCDIRLSIADADFGLTETGIGIILKSSIVRLLRDGHDGMNSLLIFTAAHFSAARMAEIRFLHQVVDDVADLQEMALVLAQQIAGNAPLALRAAKTRWDARLSRRIGRLLRKARSRIYRRMIVFLCIFMHLNEIYLL